MNAPPATLKADRHARGCPQCGQVLAVIDKHRFTCTNPNCDKFMRFTKPKPLGRRLDFPPLTPRRF